MIKKFFITATAMAFIFIGGGTDVFASASMPIDDTSKMEQSTDQNDRFSFNQWWEQWIPSEKEVEEVPAVKEEQSNEEETSNDAEQLNAYEQEVFTLTNKEREEHGLTPLKVDTELSNVAREKSLDMLNNKYFDHQSPTYGSPFDMMQQFGITYRTAGENIAMGQRTPNEVVTAWMNSEGHRANILNGDFTHIGIGYVEDGNYWTQQFIGK